MDEVALVWRMLGWPERLLTFGLAVYAIGGQVCSLLSSVIPQERMEGTWWGSLIDRWAANFGQAKNELHDEKGNLIDRAKGLLGKS